jgi:hypothetical protein
MVRITWEYRPVPVDVVMIEEQELSGSILLSTGRPTTDDQDT